MVETIDTSLIDWSRAQFALTAAYHWLFVPLTLGLAVVMGVMETVYYRTGDGRWRRTAQFWMKLFGINFAVGVATGLILEFQFGTNWSNYSWFVGDIFGAPLAIEGIVAFFMEATFIAVMFFGWDKVSRGFHLASTWLTGLGATISAWWILVANAWMQDPVGMAFNPDTMRNEMVDFWAVATSGTAVVKFFHTVMSGWVLGAVFVAGVACWYLWRGRDKAFAVRSIKVASVVGLAASVLVAWTGDSSAYNVARTQPMKLAAIEGLYDGGKGVGLVGVGVLDPGRDERGSDAFLFKIEIPRMLSLLATRDADGYVPGINDLLDGGYPLPDGTTALSTADKMERGREAIGALAEYRRLTAEGDTVAAGAARARLAELMPYFGYGYLDEPGDAVPPVDANFYAFRVMVILGGWFILFFAVMAWLAYRGDLARHRWAHVAALATIPLGYIATQVGWIVAEVGRQPWTIQDLLPVGAAVSALETSSVQATFWIFAVIFTVLLIAEIGIMLRAIKAGPQADGDPVKSNADK